MAHSCDVATRSSHMLWSARLPYVMHRFLAGTFLYVAFMEVIPRELAVPQHRTAKLGMLMLGFAAMSLLAIWA